MNASRQQYGENTYRGTQERFDHNALVCLAMRASVPQARVTEKRRETAAIFTLKAAGRGRPLLAESRHLCLPLARVLKVNGGCWSRRHEGIEQEAGNAHCEHGS